MNGGSQHTDGARKNHTDQPVPGLSSWSAEALEAHLAGLQQGHELEQIRRVAQSHVYAPAEPRAARVHRAKPSLAASRRFHSDDLRDQAGLHCQESTLHTWVIEHLGPDDDPDRNPAALARDTLAALSPGPHQAESDAEDRRDLPIEQIRALRRHKNLTAHIDLPMPNLQSGPLKNQLKAWASVRRHPP